MGICITGADSVSIEESAGRQYVPNAHIGVFFDGTNNNMVREVFGYQFINFNDDDGTENTEKRSAKKIVGEGRRKKTSFRRGRCQNYIMR